MNAINKIRTQVKVNDQAQALDATGKVTLTLFGGAATLVGLWAAACFLGALLTAGPVGVITGYFAAVTGI